MGKRGMSGSPHHRSGGGSRAKGRKGKPGYRQGKPNSFFIFCAISYRRAA